MGAIWEKSKRRPKLEAIIVLLLISVIIHNEIYLYLNRAIGSGFFFQIRVPELVTWDIENKSHFNLDSFSAFPFAPLFLGIISKVTGLSMIDTIFFPYVRIFGILFSYVFARVLLKDRLLSFFTGFALFFFLSAGLEHFVEYPIGYIAYPLFPLLVHYYVETGKKRYVGISILIFIAFKGFSPHVEHWSVIFLLSVFVIIVAIDRLSIDFGIRSNAVMIIGNYALLAIILWLFINTKFYEHLLSLRFEVNPFMNLYEFFYQLLVPTDSVTREYGSSPFNPFPVRIVNILYVISIALTLGMAALLNVASVGKNWEILSQYRLKDIIAFCALFALVPYTILKISIGRVSILIFTIIGPIVGIYFLQKHFQTLHYDINYKAVLYGLASVLLILSLSSQAVYYSYDVSRPLGDDDANGNVAVWMHNHQPELSNEGNARILADLNTHGILRTYSAKSGRNMELDDQLKFNDRFYKHIVGDDINGNTNIDSLIIDKRISHKPTQSGWDYYEPLRKNEDKIHNNENLAKSYDSNAYSILREV